MHVESGKHIYMSVLFIVVIICLLLLLVVFLCINYLFSRIRLWLQIFTVHVDVCGKLWGVCILGFVIMTVIRLCCSCYNYYAG